MNIITQKDYKYAMFILPNRITFTPTYDADGNQTLVKTKTGIWQVTYNAENRPVEWTCGTTNLVMAFDRMGRRVLSEVQVEGAPIKTETYVYDGYTCILRKTTIHTNAVPTTIRDTFVWDPTEPVATRPLVWNRVEEKSSTRETHPTAFYFHDGNKNVSDVVSTTDETKAHYAYAPFGDSFATGSLAESNPWRFSSEYADDELGCVYYNYRHYEPMTGRWLSRDPMEEVGGKNLFVFCGNRIFNDVDYLGCETVSDVLGNIWGLVTDIFSGAYGGFGHTWTLGKILIYSPPPVWAELNVTVSAEFSPCCDNGEIGVKLEFSGQIDAFAAVGVSFKKAEPNRRELKKNGLTVNSKAIDPGTGKNEKYKNHHTEANSGFKDRNAWGGLTFPKDLPQCPKKTIWDYNFYLFLRGSCGLGWGWQFDVRKKLNGTDFLSWEGVTVSGNRAWGLTGASLEIGLEGSFSAVGKVGK